MYLFNYLFIVCLFFVFFLVRLFLFFLELVKNVESDVRPRMEGLRPLWDSVSTWDFGDSHRARNVVS